MEEQKTPHSVPSPCPHCGNPAFPGENFCAACGGRLAVNWNTQGSSGFASQTISSFASLPQKIEGQKSPELEKQERPWITNSVSNGMLCLFAGSNYTYYRRAFFKLSQCRETVSWNWCAFLFTALWFFYRKMYLSGFCLSVIYCIIFRIFPSIGPLFFLFTLPACGISGNFFYRRHIQRRIRRAKEMPIEKRNTYLIKKSGTAGWVFLPLIFWYLSFMSFLMFS